jgi:hypothetical protein
MDIQQELIVGFGASMGFAIACMCFRLFRRRLQNNVPQNTPLPPQQQNMNTNPQPSAPQPYIVYIPNQLQNSYPQSFPPTYPPMYPPSYLQQTSFPQPPPTYPYPKQV